MDCPAELSISLKGNNGTINKTSEEKCTCSKKNCNFVFWITVCHSLPISYSKVNIPSFVCNVFHCRVHLNEKSLARETVALQFIKDSLTINHMQIPPLDRKKKKDASMG